MFTHGFLRSQSTAAPSMLAVDTSVLVCAGDSIADRASSAYERWACLRVP